MTNVRVRAAELAAQLEQELRRLGCWQVIAPEFDPARDGPFGMHTMAFEQWLQAVLVPALREVAAGARPMPPRSNLAAHAVREFDGGDDRDRLCELLGQVDSLS